MKLRNPGGARIYDGRKWHVVLGSAYIHDGSHRRFEVRLFRGRGKGYIKGVGGPDWTFVIPKMSFMWARKMHLMGVYRLQTRALRRLALGA